MMIIFTSYSLKPSCCRLFPLLSRFLVPSDQWGHCSGCRFPPCPLPSCQASRSRTLTPFIFSHKHSEMWQKEAWAGGGPALPAGGSLCDFGRVSVSLGASSGA